MKTLTLNVEFKSDNLFHWDIAPVGTRNLLNGNYSYSYKQATFNDEDFNACVERYKKIIKQFCNNVDENGYEEYVRDKLSTALNKDWNKDFYVEDIRSDWSISVKFNIEDDENRTPYTFYITEEQMDDIDSIMYTVHGYESMTDNQLKDATLNKMITAWYNQESNKHNQRKDGSYDKQELLDALDNATSYNDGAAYDYLEEFINDYFNGFI